MKKNVFFLLALASTFFVQAQINLSVTEDFESYKKDDFLGVKNPNRWKVLFNDPGTTADVMVSSAKAKSGTNSIYLFSNLVGGGPQNVYLPFFTDEKVQNFGTFELNMWLYIPTEQGAYFDLQAKSPIPEALAVSVYFDNSKTIRLVDENNNTLRGGSYKQDTWVKFTVKANMTTDDWSFLIDDKEFASLSLPNNSLYAMAINPQSVVNQAQFYIDDISYTFQQTPLKDIDASVTPIEMNTRFLVGKTSPIKAQIRNVGLQEITTMDVEWSDGLTTNTQTFSNLKLKSLTNQAITINAPYTAKVGANKVSIRVKSVNGKADENATNDLRELPIDVVVPAPDKKVFAEQATGTWCQWCPRGHVLMEYMAVEYPDYFVGLAVHGSGNDPMKMTNYVNSLAIQGYPSVAMDRGEIVDPYDIEDRFYDLIKKPTAAKIQTAVKWDAPRKMSITPKAIFKDGAAKGAYKIVVILLEDSIRGTTTPYSQANAYGSGRAGVMGGYEKLPTTVPFSKMAYKHVARQLLNGFNGQAKTFDNIKAGDVFELAPITYEVPTTYDTKRLEVVTMLIGPDGRANNAEMTTAASFSVAVEEVVSHPYFINISPNPAHDLTSIALNINQLSNIELRVLDMNGSTVAMQNYGQLAGEQRLNINTEDLPNGLYLVQIAIDNQMLTQKMMVQH